MKKILVTGANGFLGQHLVKYLSDGSYKVVATSRGESRLLNKEIEYYDVDLTNKPAVDDLMQKIAPDFVVHTAALSKPDECDNNRSFCDEVNVEATRNLLNSSAAFFIYISTDFIFGENGPHAETALPDPLNYYGQSKLMAEQLVQQSGKETAIVRPVFIYGMVWPGLRPSFLHWVKNNLEQNKPIKVVSDQFRTPTFVTDICAGLETIIRKRATGAYHLAGSDILSPYQMAVTTANVLGLDAGLIENVTSETFPEPVKRAKRSGLLIDKARHELDYEPVTFERGVRLSFFDE